MGNITINGTFPSTAVAGRPCIGVATVANGSGGSDWEIVHLSAMAARTTGVPGDFPATVITIDLGPNIARRLSPGTSRSYTVSFVPFPAPSNRMSGLSSPNYTMHVIGTVIASDGQRQVNSITNYGLTITPPLPLP